MKDLGGPCSCSSRGPNPYQSIHQKMSEFQTEFKLSESRLNSEFRLCWPHHALGFSSDLLLPALLKEKLPLHTLDSHCIHHKLFTVAWVAWSLLSPLASDLVSSCGSGCVLFKDTLHLSDGGWVADPSAQFFVISPKPYRETMQNYTKYNIWGCSNWRSIWNFYH